MKHLLTCLLIIGGFFSVGHAFDAAPTTPTKSLPVVGTATTIAPSPHARETAPAVIPSPDAPIAPVTLKQTPPPDVSPWSGSFYFDVMKGSMSAVVLNRLRDLTVNGHITRWELDGFVGSTLDHEGHALAGLAVIRKFTLADQIFLLTGAGISFQGGSPVGFGLFGGLGVKF